MKALFCQACGDIQGLRAGEVSTCKCGNTCAAWQDPIFGRAVFAGERTEFVWCLGIHNGFLAGDNVDYGCWRDAVGYLFLTHESPVVRIRPGSSGDTQMLGRSAVEAAAKGELKW